jgi:hypothetical protein
MMSAEHKNYGGSYCIPKFKFKLLKPYILYNKISPDTDSKYVFIDHCLQTMAETTYSNSSDYVYGSILLNILSDELMKKNLALILGIHKIYVP